MQFGNNENGMRIHIGDADPKTQYYCPYCNALLIQRRGDVKIHYFAHKQGHLCTDDWHHPMSEWHLSWQSRYPLENREIALINHLGQHRADILVNKTVVEFQHSHIPVGDFKERNAFYTACGYRVIWLFDAREVFQSKLTKSGTKHYAWKYPPKMLTNFNVYGNVHVYFHIHDDTTQRGGEIIRLTDFSNKNLSFFGVAPSEHYTEKEFVELTRHSFLAKETDSFEKDKLYHTLYYIRRLNGETECYGCPINPDGYAPQIREHHRITCEECRYCKDASHDSHVVKCAGRYHEHLEQMVRVLEQHSNTINNTITYIDTNGNLQEATIDHPLSPTKSIPKLAQEYIAKVMIVRNVRSGKEYKIFGDVEAMVRRYKGKIYGQYRNGDHWTDSKEIFYANNQEWIVVGFAK